MLTFLYLTRCFLELPVDAFCKTHRRTFQEPTKNNLVQTYRFLSYNSKCIIRNFALTGSTADFSLISKSVNLTEHYENWHQLESWFAGSYRGTTWIIILYQNLQITFLALTGRFYKKLKWKVVSKLPLINS